MNEYINMLLDLGFTIHQLNMPDPRKGPITMYSCPLGLFKWEPPLKLDATGHPV